MACRDAKRLFTASYGLVQPLHQLCDCWELRPRATENGEIAFIDWARARFGSPLEDLASWLHSLGWWEPEARRRHDTLLRVYLEARSSKQRITTELRTLYWYASASNGLSGAIRYHLLVLIESGDCKRNEERLGANPSFMGTYHSACDRSIRRIVP